MLFLLYIDDLASHVDYMIFTSLLMTQHSMLSSKHLRRNHRRTAHGAEGGCSPYNFWAKKQVIFGQKHLIFVQAMEKYSVRDFSAPERNSSRTPTWPVDETICAERLQGTLLTIEKRTTDWCITFNASKIEEIHQQEAKPKPSSFLVMN